ncbi:hypothetical protein AAC387_Pa10g0795 [Persea americana]
MGEDPTNLVKAHEDLAVYVIEIKSVTRNFRALNEIPPIRVSNSSSRVTTSLRRLLAVVAHSPFANFNCRRGADHDNSEGDSTSEVSSESAVNLRLPCYFLSHLRSILAKIPSWPYSFLCNIRVHSPVTCTS